MRGSQDYTYCNQTVMLSTGIGNQVLCVTGNSDVTQFHTDGLPRRDSVWSLSTNLMVAKPVSRLVDLLLPEVLTRPDRDF
jgi:hypothetical protein